MPDGAEESDLLNPLRSSARRLRLAVATLLLATLACGPPLPPHFIPPVTILVDPRPFESIEQAAEAESRVTDWSPGSPAATACTQSFAAIELRRFLARAGGLDEEQIRLARPGPLPPAGDVIVLGARDEDLEVAKLLRGEQAPSDGDPDGFTLRAFRRGKRSLFVIAGNSRTGTLYGTYAFLELLGVWFYGLGDTGTVLPASPAPAPRRLRVMDGPRYRTRGFWAFEPRGNRDFLLWMARNRMNLWTADEPDPAFLHKLGIRLTAGGHRVQADYLDLRAILPGGTGRTRFAAHPEWYGLVGDQRRGDIVGESGTNFCTSNADARAAFARGLIADLEVGRLRDATVIQVWPLDGGRWCECDACRAQGSPTDRWLDVVATVSAQLNLVRRAGRLTRPIELVAPAYLETLAPPTRPVSPDLDPAVCTVAFFPYFRCYAHALADSSCTELNRRLRDAYEGWATAPDRFYTGPLAVGEYYNVSWVHSLPVVYTRAMGADLPWYARSGAREVFSMHAPTRLWGAWTLDHAVLARLLWSPEVSAEAVVSEFCSRYFADAAEPMRSYYQHLERATKNITALAHCVGAFGTTGAVGGRLADPRFPLFPLQHLQERTVHPAANDAPDLDEIAAAMRAARRALDAARDPMVVARLREEERRFAYGEAMFSFWEHLIRVAAFHRAGDTAAARREWPAVEAEAVRLRAVHDLVQVAASHANARDGLEASQVVPTYEFFRRRYSSGVR